MLKKIVDIEDGELDLYVDGKFVLHIGQVSDDETINLFLCPKGAICVSAMFEEDSNSECTHELLANRED